MGLWDPEKPKDEERSIMDSSRRAEGETDYEQDHEARFPKPHRHNVRFKPVTSYFRYPSEDKMDLNLKPKYAGELESGSGRRSNDLEEAKFQISQLQSNVFHEKCVADKQLSQRPRDLNTVILNDFWRECCSYTILVAVSFARYSESERCEGNKAELPNLNPGCCGTTGGKHPMLRSDQIQLWDGNGFQRIWSYLQALQILFFKHYNIIGSELGLHRPGSQQHRPVTLRDILMALKSINTDLGIYRCQSQASPPSFNSRSRSRRSLVWRKEEK
jgi:hypothetical protein